MSSFRLFTKSEAAFRLSYRQLWAASDKLFFWTFTAEFPENDRRFSRAWNGFWSRINPSLRFDYAGLRVFQVHEGGGERDGYLHAHLVCNERLPVGMLRRYASCT